MQEALQEVVPLLPDPQKALRWSPTKPGTGQGRLELGGPGTTNAPVRPVALDPYNIYTYRTNPSFLLPPSSFYIDKSLQTLAPRWLKWLGFSIFKTS